MKKLDLSVTIICKNEAHNLPRLLKSVDFANEVIVVDDHSSDESAEICSSFGAKVFQRSFDGFGQQKNYAASKASYDWVLSLDCDEEVTPELKQSINEVLSKPNGQHIFSVDRKTFFLGQFIRFGGWYPDQVARFYQKSKAKFTEPNVHEVLKSHEEQFPRVLDGSLNHFSFATISSQVERNMKYAKLGAKQYIEQHGRPSLIAVFFRPFWKFIECLFLKAGILDGVAGIIIALNASYSMFMKYTFAYFDFSKDLKRIGE